jgi:RNA polymerase sigma-70 factor (ECF subfamily)
MIAVARNYVKTRDVAEEVVQEAWLGILKGLDRFEGRSSLKTWILRILVNTAATRGGREGRSLPFSSLAPAGEEGPAVEPERFRPPGGAFAGHWNGYPGDWSSLPEEALSGRETLDVAKRAIAELPASQRSGDHHARHRGLQRGGGLRDARGIPRQPTGPAASGALLRARSAREILG